MMTSQSEYPSRGSSPELLTRNVEAASRIERITSQEALGIVNEMTEQQEEPEDANVARLFASMSKSMANMKIITAEGSVVQKTLDEYNRSVQNTSPIGTLTHVLGGPAICVQAMDIIQGLHR
jgi:hypothetical protein